MEIAAMLTTRSQRWRERRARFVDDFIVVDPSAYTVETIDHSAARRFIAQHHYLPSYPAAHIAVGLIDRSRALAGVAVFAVPTTGAVITRHTGFPKAESGCVLARLVLLDCVPQNGESFFVGRALKLLRRDRERIEAVVSYSDPSAGHIGRVYAALSARHCALSRPRSILRAGGTTVSGRTLSKIRLGESGQGGAIDRLIQLGVPPPGRAEDPRQWLDRLRRDRHLVRDKQPGLFTYSFALTREARRRATDLPRLPYPKALPAENGQLLLYSA
jgi:hypothetical protein